MIFTKNLIFPASLRPKTIIRKIVPLTLPFMVALSTGAKAEERIDLERGIREAESILAQVESYTAIFHKQERIKGKLTEEETVFLKFKKPFKVYMKWIKHPYKGRESLYVEGWNNNRIKVRECGIMGVVTVNVDPSGKLAMGGSRHPITESGLDNLVKRIGKDLRRSMVAGELEFKKFGQETIYGKKTQLAEVIFPKDETKGYYCYRAVINLDIEKRLPLKVQIHDWNDNLIENYGYEDLRLNAGLSDAEFDPKNPEYRF